MCVMCVCVCGENGNIGRVFLDVDLNETILCAQNRPHSEMLNEFVCVFGAPGDDGGKITHYDYVAMSRKK